MGKIIILLILTTLCWGITPILEKIGLVKASPLAGVVVRNIAVTVFMLFYMISSGNIKSLGSLDTKTIMIFSISGIIAGGLGMLTYFGALKIGATSKIVPIAASYPLVTALLSVLILGEHVSLLRVIGTALIITGVWLVR